MHTTNIDTLIEYISKLRNERIDFANRTYGINKGIYHCVVRRKNEILFYNCDYKKIDLSKVNVNKNNNKSFSFSSDKEEYYFNFAKSTLYKKFYVPDNAIKIKINIIENPLELIFNLFKTQETHFIEHINPYIYLPLYSTKNGKRYVAEKSSLNQWNAGGRKRDYGEVYIYIPSYINKKYPNFFPNRNISFELVIPTGQILIAKVYQDGSKALMANPNKALSNWLLRSVFKLEEGELLTYSKLEDLNIDSVLITKLNDHKFSIDFASLGSFDNFIDK